MRVIIFYQLVGSQNFSPGDTCSFSHVASDFAYSETVNNRTRGANNLHRGGPGGPGTVFCFPGAVFLSQ